ncbi:MAG: MoaD/ThiS family protein [bacterium]|nr:MoaD/ThiS family protein [bacterium]
MEIKINLALQLNNLSLYEEQTFSFSKDPSVKDILAALNKQYNTNIFTKRTLKKRLLVVMVNGCSIEPGEIKKVFPSEEDTITVLQPLAGG